MHRSRLHAWLEYGRGGPIRFFQHGFHHALDQVREFTVAGLSSLIVRARCAAWGYPCGRGLQAYGRVIMRGPPQGIQIRDGVQLISSSWRCTAAALGSPVRLRTFSRNARIILDKGCSLNGTSITARTQTVHIGCNSMIGPECLIIDSDFHAPWPAAERKFSPGLEHDASVRIGDNVWVGARSIILKGVTIGDNAIIAAGSVVTRSLPPDCLAAGNPARVIKENPGNR